MDRWRGRVALVTGGSSGIGYSLTKALAERGMKVVACAPDIEAIQNLEKEVRAAAAAAGSVTAVKCDVSKEEEVKAMFQRIGQDSSLGRVDVCINNAGLAHDEPLLTGDPAKWKHMFDVNVLGLMMVTKEAFKMMQDNNIDDGHIILINSMAGIRMETSKHFHCYCATKFAVTAIREGLRNELREKKSKIRVSQVCPCLVKTDFLYHHSGQRLAPLIFSLIQCLQTDDISDSVLFILDAPPHVEINDVHISTTQQVGRRN